MCVCVCDCVFIFSVIFTVPCSVFPPFLTLGLEREELREGLQVIARGAAGGPSSFEGLRNECRKSRRSAAAKGREEQEQ